jgi:hypothetical protein
VALPADWQAQPLPLPTINLDQVPTLTPEQRRADEASNQFIESVAVRFDASGEVPSSLLPAGIGSAGVLVFVQGGDASLGGFADRMTQWFETNFGATILSRTDVNLSSGTAIRVDSAWEVNGQGEPDLVRDYLFRLPDGRSMAIEFDWGTLGSAALDQFSTEVINTLRSAS